MSADAIGPAGRNMVASSLRAPDVLVVTLRTVRAADEERAPRLENAAARDEEIALRRREEIDLELDGENGVGRRHQAVRSVAAGAVGDRRGRAGVKEAVLLRQTLAEGQLDLARARTDFAELGPERPHEPLPTEARAHTLGIAGIGGLEVRLRRLHREGSAGLYTTQGGKRHGPESVRLDGEISAGGGEPPSGDERRLSC
jgi:hypothetical protein